MRKVSIISVLIALTFTVFGQKLVIDKETCDNWISLQVINGKSCVLSNDGKFIVYQYGSQAEGSTIVLKSLNGQFERSFHHASSPIITEDSKRFITILPGDSLLIYNFIKKDSLYILSVQSYNIPEDGNGQWIVYKKQGAENILVLRNLFNGREKSYPSVERATFNEQGTVLLLNTAKGLIWVDLSTGKEQFIAESKNTTDFRFDSDGKQIAFVTSDTSGNVIKYFTEGMSTSDILAKNGYPGIDRGYEVAAAGVSFTKDGKKILFQLKKTEIVPIPDQSVITKDVNVWRYKDRILQEKRSTELRGFKFMPETYTAVVHFVSKEVFQLENDSLRIVYNSIRNNYALLSNKVSDDEFYWNGEVKRLYLLSIIDGSTKKLFESSYPSFLNESISPDEKYAIWFNRNDNAYYTYEMRTGIFRNITLSTKTFLSKYIRGEADLIRDRQVSYGIAGWLKRDERVLIYDRTDIWNVDPLGKSPSLNVTHAVGNKRNLTFRLAFDYERLSKTDAILLTAFNNDDKQNGFYSINLLAQNLDSCILEDKVFYFEPTSKTLPIITTSSVDPTRFEPVKSKMANVYIVRRMSSSEAPNLFYTKDFKLFKQITKLNQLHSTSVITELVTWRLSNGQVCHGVLHKPYNWDTTKKYPVIFNYYQRRSDGVNIFRDPTLMSHNINIPWFVNRGYLIFEPDMYYETGNVRQSIVNVVESAVKYLSRYPYIDTSKIGIQGQSFGGYETNVIVTKSNIFKAACEMAGPTDLVSEYGSIRPGGHNNQSSADIGQRNLNVFPWEHPYIFIENSPIFHINKIGTPLLMIHNKDDNAIAFSQAIELYIGMRRIGKKVWLLEYDKEDHTLVDEKNKLDLTIRVQQFFDHYLKHNPAPLWMIEGLDAKNKGIKSGLELDTLEREP